MLQATLVGSAAQLSFWIGVIPVSEKFTNIDNLVYFTGACLFVFFAEIIHDRLSITLKEAV